MRTRYRRREPTKQDTVGAAAASVVLAVGVGVVTFYVTRLFLARDTMTEPEEPKLLEAPGE